MTSDIEKIKDLDEIRLASCIPHTHERDKERLEDIKWFADETDADILFFPEEYFGGPTKKNGSWEIKSYSTMSGLMKSLKDITSEYEIGLAVGLIEKGIHGGKGKLYQTIWFFDSGRYVGFERKYNRAFYEMEFYKLSANPNDCLVKKPQPIKGTTGTGLLCWEAFDFNIKAAIYDLSPDWALDAIKFPTDYYPMYDRESGEITGFGKSDESNDAWKKRLELIAEECLTIVPYSCNATFGAFRDLLPKDARQHFK